MIRKQKQTTQGSFFNGLADLVDQKHPLYRLSHCINWQNFDEAFEPLYSEKMGAPAKPIRLMVSLLILKYLRNLSDESVVEQWSENIYFQYLGGEQFFRPSLPCVPTELVAFRYRIGSVGMELILKESIRINKPEGEENIGKTVSMDTTVQEKSITYPTDDKLYKKIIIKCVGIARKEGIVLKQTYAKELKKLSIDQRFKKRKNGAKIARKASKRVKTIAGRIHRNLVLQLSVGGICSYEHQLIIYEKVLAQNRGDKNKIYSLHEPNVTCYAKGKEHKKFEFGSKVSVTVCQHSGIILGALNFAENIHDSRTVEQALEQVERLHGKAPEEVFADRGYVGKTQHDDTKIYTPKTNPNITKQQRKKHSKRAGIEPVIGHLKTDYRLCRNFLKGIFGDQVNIILSAAAMNFKRRIVLWRTEAKLSWQFVLLLIVNVRREFYAQKLKLTF